MNDPNQPPAAPETHRSADSVETVPPAFSKEERLWAMLGHLSALAGIPFPIVGNIVGPLIVWQVKKDTMPFASEEAKEALNFNISWALWSLLIGALTVFLVLTIIGMLLVPFVIVASIAVGIIWIVFMIVGGLRANEGRPYRYPLTVRFIA